MVDLPPRKTKTKRKKKTNQKKKQQKKKTAITRTGETSFWVLYTERTIENTKGSSDLLHSPQNVPKKV